MTDATHDPARRSWVESAEGSDFPIQNLPYGRFRRDESDAPRLGVAIGDQILDLRLAAEAGLVDPIAGGGMLNPIMAIGADGWRALRESIGLVLDAKSTKLPELLVPQSDAEMLVPAWIGDYTDFYCSIHHATNVGAMFRPDNPLLPNYKHLPIGYHGRASSIVDLRHRGAPSARADRRRGRPAAELRSDPSARLRDGDGLLRRRRQRARPSDRHEFRARSALRHVHRQRLVRARRAEVGVPAARPVQREELLHLGESVGGDARRARAVPRTGRSTRRR